MNDRSLFHRIILFLLLNVSLFLSSCTFVKQTFFPQQYFRDQAIDIVWHQAYGRTDKPPRVVFISGPLLNCGDNPDDRGFVWFIDGRLTCLDGISFPSNQQMSDGVSLISYDGWEKYSDTSLAHELCHIRLYREVGDGDGQHKGPCYIGQNGQPSFTDAANQLLKSKGL